MRGVTERGPTGRAGQAAGFLLATLLLAAGTTDSAQAQSRGRSTDTVTGSCVFSYGAANCVRQYRYGDSGNSGIKRYVEPTEEVAETREREKAWEERCRPTLRHDIYGVGRYVYAERGCEYGMIR